MNRKKGGFMEKVAAVIVDKRNIFFLLFILAAVFCVFSQGWVNTNDDLTAYLDPDTETCKGLAIMDEEFVEFASARVAVANVSYASAQKIADALADIDGVHSVDFDGTPEHYKNAAALFSVTFDGETGDETAVAAMDEVRSLVSPYDAYISTEIGNPLETIIGREMRTVLIIAVCIIIAVLLLTSNSYMEVPVLLITFGAAALLNMGTNYWFGTISYITDSIAIVLQLALAIDYAIIMCHRFTEEREHLDARDAAVAALAKAIPEISSSSLTTVSGLVALTFMSFRLGYDMGIVLIKAIIMSLISVFFLMPGLLVLFSKLMDKTRHRNFVPKISGWGRLAVKTRYVVPPVFILIVIGAFVCSNRCPYVYGYSTLDTVKQNENQIAEKFISENFGDDNFVAIVVPAGDYEKEAALLKELESRSEVKSTLGLAGIEALDGYTLTDALAPRQFAELTDQDIEVARILYTGYAARQEDYGRIVSDIDSYRVPLIDMFGYLYEQSQAGYVSLDRELQDTLDALNSELTFAKVQLQGEHRSRALIYLDLPEESEETFAFLDTIHEIAEKYYDEVYLVGESVNERDLKASFSEDNLMISILSALFVMAVLLFTFKSVGLPVLLIIVIQSSIWINFSYPYLTNSNLFFISYLIVSAIQMGANIDYAIVISSRYFDLRESMSARDAAVEAVNQAFPTIITSGLMLASAGFIIGQLTSDCTISSIGTCLGRGTLISIFLVMSVLPQLLILGDTIVEKTRFSIRHRPITHVESGTVHLRGRVRGQVSGYMDAEVSGLFQGSIKAMVETKEPPREAEPTDKEAVTHED